MRNRTVTVEIPEDVARALGPVLTRAVRSDLARLSAEPDTWRRRLQKAWDAIKGREDARLATLTYRGDRALFNILAEEYQAKDIDYETLERMRKDPIVHYGLTIKTAPVKAAMEEAFVECSDPNIAEFVKQVFVKPHLWRLTEIAMQALVDGAAFAEKIWEVRDIHVERDGEVVWDGPALVYKEFRYNKITTIVPSLPLTEDGSFNGYYQKKGFDKVHVPAWKAWLYPHNFLRAGFWGEPALNHVYAPWFFKCKLWVMRMLYYSKHAAPTKIGWAPPGRSTNEDGDEVDNLQWLGDRLHKTDEFTTLAMPMVRDDRGNKLWDITQLDVTGRGDLYARGIEALNDEILRGLVCVETPPERGGARTYYEGLGRLEAYLTACDTLALDFLSYVNQYAVRQLVVDHFGERAPECYVRHNPLFSLKRRVLYNVLQTAINAQHPELGEIALTELAKILKIPVHMVGALDRATGVLGELINEAIGLLHAEGALDETGTSLSKGSPTPPRGA